MSRKRNARIRECERACAVFERESRSPLFLSSRQAALTFYLSDGGSQRVVVEENLRCIDLCHLLTLKLNVARSPAWTLVERIADLRIGECVLFSFCVTTASSSGDQLRAKRALKLRTDQLTGMLRHVLERVARV